MADSGFSAEWLALREAADTKARNAELPQSLKRFFAQKEELRILDLGAGSGANLRCLAPQLPARQSWQLADNDPELLALALERRLPEVQVETLCCDLARRLDRLDLVGVDLVTASALMDLVSADWFDTLARRCCESGAAVFFVLSYDGTIDFAPIDADDEPVRELVNEHQQGDKGFGSALGPRAPAHMEATLRTLGYDVRGGRSDWQLGPDDAALQDALFAGYTAAARELAPDEEGRLKAWLNRRRAHLAAGRSHLRVGHIDLLALP